MGTPQLTPGNHACRLAYRHPVNLISGHGKLLPTASVEFAHTSATQHHKISKHTLPPQRAAGARNVMRELTSWEKSIVTECAGVGSSLYITAMEEEETLPGIRVDSTFLSFAKASE